MTWTKPELKGEAPAARSGHTFSTVGMKNIVFGGCGRTSEGKAETFGDVWNLDFSNPDLLKWTELQPEGEAPAPRSRHTATPVGKKLLVFGGLNHRERYNDAWMFNSSGKEGSWERLEIEGQPPPPRAHHSAVLIKNQVFFFGGYGGHGKVYNDLWILDLGDEDTPMRWVQPATKGKAPAPCFDHTVSYYPDKMVIFGGRDNSRIFKAMHLFDLETLTWENDVIMPDFSSDVCNNVSDAIESVPNYKLFTFGGKAGMMQYLDKVDVMDCGSLVWSSPSVHGKPPCAREDTAWVYDNKTCRLVMFGGWANRWLGDTWALNVSPVIGPPYACMSVEPKVGPVFGDTLIKIKGLGFRNSGKIEVRFGSGKNEVTVNADFVDSETLTCKTPNYEEFGAMNVDIRVSISKEGWTVNRVRFDFFANTAAKNCFCIGPGILSDGICGATMPFLIQSKDTCNAKRISGGDDFIVNVESVDDPALKGAFSIKDLEMGHYQVNYSVPKPGRYKIEVMHDDLDEDTASGNIDLIPVRGSPFTIMCQDPLSYPKISGKAPSFVEGSSFVTVGTSFVLMGGHSTFNVLSKKGIDWEWSVPEVAGKSPAARTHHTALSSVQNVVVFGGKDENGMELNDFHVLKKSPDGYAWLSISLAGAPVEQEAPTIEELPPAEDTEDKPVEGDGDGEGGSEAAEGDEKAATESAPAPAEAPATKQAPAPAPEQAVAGPGPTPRCNNGACLIGKDLFVLGGEQQGEIVDDFALLKLDISKATAEWTTPEVSKGSIPSNRTCPSMIATSGANAKVFIFGGMKIGKDDEGDEVLGDFHVITVGKESWKCAEQTPNGDVPCARYGAKFIKYGRDKYLFYGGIDAEGRPLNDAYFFDPETATFTSTYRGESSALPSTGILATFLDTEMVAMSANSKGLLENATLIDLHSINSKFSFNMCMNKKSGVLLDDMEVWAGQIEEALALASDPNEVKDITKLLKVIDALYQIRTKLEMKNLLVDQLWEIFSVLAKNKTSVSAKESQLQTVQTLLEELIESAPAVKAKIQSAVDVEGERIRREIQEFATEVDGYKKDFSAKQFFDYASGAQASYRGMDEVTRDLSGFHEEAAEKYRLADMFEFAEIMEPTMMVLRGIEDDLRVIKYVWDVSSLVETQFASWRSTLWNAIDTEAMEDASRRFVKEVKTLPKQARLYNAFDGLDTSVKNFLVTIPLVADLRSPDMRDRHWKMLMEATGVSFTINASFKLDDLLKLELHKFADDVGEIVDQAQKEAKMEKNLSKLNETWGSVEFVFTEHKGTNVHTIKLGEEDVESLEDNQVLVLGMMSNRFKDTFGSEIDGWNKKLMLVADVTQIMGEIQQTWAYLESLFIHSDEVKKELPDAAQRFKSVDTEVKRILAEMKSTKNAVRCCTKSNLMENLQKQQSELELCEKALADYMESKRRAFPRFYFTSTAVLLDILSNGNVPAKVQAHMSQCFQAIDKLKLDNEDTNTTARPNGLGMISCVGKEYIEFRKPLPLTGKVEEYMNAIIAKMRGELRDVLSDSIKSYSSKPRTEWLLDWPSQIILVVNGITWTQEVEEAILDFQKGDKNALKKCSQNQVKQLSDLISMTRTPLEKPDRQKVMNMITIDAHNRDITLGLVEKKTDKLSSFDWACQLRGYWDNTIGDCRLKICDASFPYGYEYLGNGGRLVITPLTDRIYITATQACWLSLGTAPQGPAGTGKTESTKDLSAQLGKSVYVFNCSPEMDYRTMGDIFKGLAASGSWGCFDEFNRLVPSVLSVCSVQYKAVCDAQRVKSLLPGRGLDYIDKEGTKHKAVENYKFTAADGVEMPLEEGCSAFITMNPGYIGRAELPESLKILFRPITVMVPDRQLIMENMLMAEGFTEAKILAKKFASLYYLLEDLLSPEKHYDWGLRAIKSVLVVAGSLLRAREGQPEADVLYRALRDFNIPKISGNDLPIFMGLLKDLFPGTDPERERDFTFEEVIKETATEMGLTVDNDFILRTVQLSELLAIRHCVFLMGPTGVGRTECYSVLAKAIEKGTDNPENPYLQINNKKKVLIKDINPKAISTYELYGYVNMSTREWKDGLFSYTMREMSNSGTDDPKWIILDGDLDANWIESMNSTMDDNRLLTLPSNERIRLLPPMKLLFEIRNLKFATPATATRAGILYISEVRQWNNMVQSWINRVVPAYANEAKWANKEQPVIWLREFFEKYVPTALFEMKKSFSFITPLASMNLVTSLVNILESVLTPKNISAKAEKPLMETYFVFAMVWAFGSGLCNKDGIDYRKNFDKMFKQTFSTIRFPSKGTVYDYYVNPASGKFSTWSEMVPEVSFDSSSMVMSEMFVPTGETASLTFFMDQMVSQGKPVMFVGSAGCGKTQLVKGQLAKLPEDVLSQNITFNYFTEVSEFQNTLESKLEKKAGINFGPPGTKKLVYFVDDLNMPKLDPYETAMPISHMRQHIGWNHWFDRAKLTQKNVNNTQYVACMNPTAGAFVINPRLQRLFMTLAVQFPGQDSLMQIFGTFLQGHLSSFSADVQELGTKIVQAALANHTKVVQSFRKTAVNFHYEFTIRHLANVFQGLLRATVERFDNVDAMAKLWLHESERVYADRLVSEAHLDTYNKSVEGVAKKFFSIPDIKDYYKASNPKPLIFSDFAHGLDEKEYDSIDDWETLQVLLNNALSDYNDSNAVMDLVLFRDAMKHVCRISRIIGNSSGHALLVGVGGSGKQSLTKLASHVCGYQTMSIVISGGYNLANFKEDLQKMYRIAGLKGQGVTFLLTEAQIVDERFLVLINDLLASGEVQDLFAQEDMDEICNAMRGEVKAAGQIDTADNCWAFFINKVKANLHVVFTTSPVGEDFRVRSQRFLATVTCTVIDWFQPWPENSLLDVATKFLADVDLGDAATRKGIAEFMPFSFKCVNAASEKYKDLEKRYNYTTPKTFLELIKLYTGLLKKKREASMSKISRLEEGVTKIEATQEMVAKLVEEANRKAAQVEEKVASSDAFAEKVGIEKEKANEENAAAQIEAEKCGVIATEVAAKQASCEEELGQAEPLVQEAMAALDTLNKKDLGELKSLGKPPAGVDDVTAVILILLQGNPKDKSWKAAQKMMKDVNSFLQALKEYKPKIDAGEVQKKHVDACRPYLSLEHFNRETMQKKSGAAAGLTDFAINIVKYFDVVSMVEPKRQELREANEKLESANTRLAEVNEQVRSLNEMVADLERQFTEAIQEKEEAIAESERTQRKLGLANRLVNALSASVGLWKETVTKLRGEYDVLPGDMLLSAAFCSYTGSFTSKYRKDLVQQWIAFMVEKKTPMTPGLSDPVKVMVDDATIAQWVSEGLPSDPTSIQNATILTNSERWGLMCDPQLQGIAWIKEKESKNNLQVVRLGQSKTLSIIERSMEAGDSVLIENMGESIDAVLAPVITRAFVKKGRSFYVTIGDKEVEFHKNFRLYLHTKLSNPHYPPEIQAETTLINFTVTEKGLEDQLLALVVNKERPDLEETKTQLIIRNNEYTIKLKELEDKLLQQLAEAQGDITENIELIESLEESKAVADDINAKVIESQETEKTINESREKYRSVATRGAMLFFMLNSLNKIHAFYQFSLNAFVTVFARGMDNAPGGKKKKFSFKAIVRKATGKFDWNVDLLRSMVPSAKASSKKAISAKKAEPEMTPEQLEIRLNALITTCTFTIFEYTRIGLFEKDKLIVSSLLAMTIMLRQGDIDEDEYSALCMGIRSPSPPPITDELSIWMNDTQWSALEPLSKLPKFFTFAKDLEKNSDEWKDYCGIQRCECSSLPGEWGKMTDFQQLLIIRALRPDRLTNALSIFVENNLGPEYTSQDAFNAGTVVSQSGPSTPVFFVLFPGYSPSSEIEEEGKNHDKTRTNGGLTIISMGQGQEKIAEGALDKAMETGSWVFLDNVHLMQEWVINVLERKLEIAAETANDNFRCFFSAEPIMTNPMAKIIPESVLQTCIKISNEPPTDMKSSMRRAFAAFSQETIDRVEEGEKQTAFKSILFGLCFYHSLLLGRKKFGVGIGTGAGSGLGFCRGYSFNMGDLTTCADVLYNYISANDKVPWEDLRYMFGEVFYGGWITDAMDRRCCITYLDVLIKPELLPNGSSPPSLELAPNFKAPMPTDYNAMKEFIESGLPAESPVMYGLHPNAEISLLTTEGEQLFRTIVEVSGGGGGGGGGGSKEGLVRSSVDMFSEKLPEQFVILDIEAKVAEKTPYIICALQEAVRMNTLLGEMSRSLAELKLGLEGSLNMSAEMEALARGFETNSVPALWMSTMSTRVQEVLTLTKWFADVLKRYDQLKAWTQGKEIVTPVSMWLPGLFNPKAFVTAVMQTYARANKLPLDAMKFVTEVTAKMDPAQVTEHPAEGAYVHGLCIEGARWDRAAGCLKDSTPGELHQAMPVIWLKPVTVDKYNVKGFYNCPVYMNMQRANVYSAQVSVFTLKTKDPNTKWTLASVALLLQDDLA